MSFDGLMKMPPIPVVLKLGQLHFRVPLRSLDRYLLLLAFPRSWVTADVGDRLESETMKVEEAARVLGIGRQTAYDLAAQGKLPGALRLGRRIVVSRRALERFLESPDAGTGKETHHG